MKTFESPVLQCLIKEKNHTASIPLHFVSAKWNHYSEYYVFYMKNFCCSLCLCLKVPRKSWYKEKHENSEGLSSLVKPHLWPPHNKMCPPFVNLCEWLFDSDPKRLGFVASSWKLEVCKRYIYSSCFYIEFIIGGFW